VQTPTHLDVASGEARYNPNYKWNEWDLRREVVQMLSSSEGQRGTRGAQTQRGHSRKESPAQNGRGHLSNGSPSKGITLDASSSRRHKKTVVVGLTGKNGAAVEHVLLEDLMASI